MASMLLGSVCRVARCSRIFQINSVSILRKSLPNVFQLNTTPIWGKNFAYTQHLSCQRQLHLSAPRHDLMEFFDEKEWWSEHKLKTGRPWSPEELRLKSNTDLHKLWYVLLKERNVVMTMEAEYNEQNELLPAPERLEKVEESMENLLDVVAERERAYNLLQTGDDGEPKIYETINVLGQTFKRRPREHFMPKHANPIYRRGRVYKWQEKFLREFREKRLLRKDAGRARAKRYREQLKDIFPDADV